MVLKKREMFLVYVIGGLLGVWIVSRLVFVPFHGKLVGYDRQVALEEARLRKGLALVEKKDEINKQYGKYDTYFSLHSASSEEAVAAFLKEVEKVGRATGLQILDVKPQKDAEEDKFSRQYQINIKAEADMEQLVKFLYALYNSPLLFGVDKMVLVPKGESASTLNISMTLVGVVFS